MLRVNQCECCFLTNAMHRFLLLEASAVSGTADSKESARIVGGKSPMLFPPSFPFL